MTQTNIVFTAEDRQAAAILFDKISLDTQNLLTSTDAHFPPESIKLYRLAYEILTLLAAPNPAGTVSIIGDQMHIKGIMDENRPINRTMEIAAEQFWDFVDQDVLNHRSNLHQAIADLGLSPIQRQLYTDLTALTQFFSHVLLAHRKQSSEPTSSGINCTAPLLFSLLGAGVGVGASAALYYEFGISTMTSLAAAAHLSTAAALGLHFGVGALAGLVLGFGLYLLYHCFQSLRADQSTLGSELGKNLCTAAVIVFSAAAIGLAVGGFVGLATGMVLESLFLATGLAIVIAGAAAIGFSCSESEPESASGSNLILA